MSSFPYSVIVCDLDGTLLMPDSTVSERTQRTLQRLSEIGVHIVFATGRHHCDAYVLLKSFELPKPGFLITSNGSRVYMIKEAASSNKMEEKQNDMESLYECDIDSDVVYDLLQLLPEDEKEINISLFGSDYWKSNLDWPILLEYFKMSGFRYTLIKPHELILQYQLYQEQQKQQKKCGTESQTADSHDPFAGIIQVAFGSKNTERLQELERLILAKHQERTTVAFSSAFTLDIGGEGVTKGNALKQLLKRLSSHGASFSLEDCIAFGDSMNDEHLLSIVGKGCIMSNALLRLKEALPHLECVPSNTEDGVAKKLSEIFGLPL